MASVTAIRICLEVVALPRLCSGVNLDRVKTASSVRGQITWSLTHICVSLGCSGKRLKKPGIYRDRGTTRARVHLCTLAVCVGPASGHYHAQSDRFSTERNVGSGQLPL